MMIIFTVMMIMTPGTIYNDNVTVIIIIMSTGTSFGRRTSTFERSVGKSTSSVSRDG